jgi:hypothetical protein
LEGRNSFNPASHCDIAWAGALATEAHLNSPRDCGAATVNGYVWTDTTIPLFSAFRPA